jgi:hypothetical protein
MRDRVNGRRLFTLRQGTLAMPLLPHFGHRSFSYQSSTMRPTATIKRLIPEAVLSQAFYFGPPPASGKPQLAFAGRLWVVDYPQDQRPLELEGALQMLSNQFHG